MTKLKHHSKLIYLKALRDGKSYWIPYKEITKYLPGASEEVAEAITIGNG